MNACHGGEFFGAFRLVMEMVSDTQFRCDIDGARNPKARDQVV